MRVAPAPPTGPLPHRRVPQRRIEEKVVALQEHKRDLFAKVVDDGDLMGAPLSADDIRALMEG